METVKIKTKSLDIELSGSVLQEIGKVLIKEYGRAEPLIEKGEVESITLPLDGRMVQFDVTDQGPGWIRFDSCECLGRAPWNESGQNLDGDIENASINEYIIAKIEPKIPMWLYEMMAYTERFTKEEGIYSTKLFLPDASEVFGEDDWYINRYDQLDYYKNPRNRVKADPEGEETCHWWTASAISGNATISVFVYASGFSTDDSASNAYGVPVCFRINKADLGRLISEALNSGGSVRRRERSQR